MSSLLIRNIKTLVQAENQPRQVVKGADMATLPVVHDAFILIENDRIAAFGPMSGCPERADTVLDASGRMVFPSWCDSHTHIVFAASREEEFVDRIRGLTYEEIARRGGGILNSARRLQEVSEEHLFDNAWQRLQEVIGYGTGAIEIKSGYGLSLESELKMLRVIRRLKETSPIPVKATFLGAHAVPAEYRDRRNEYIALIIHKMLPRVAGEGLADYCDVFCDKGFFTPEETEQILKAGWRYGLKPKIHANELGYTGGVQVGVANHAISVDHLEYTGDAEIAVLTKSDTLPTLLPSCAFFLGIPYAPARKMMDAGLPVVLATDYNPGSSPSGKMPFVIALACIKMKMLPEEAINAATVNGAKAMELEAGYGSIAVGKMANLFISAPIPSLAYLPYAFGSNIVETVVLRGKVWEPPSRQ
ncbi:MAG: imidazolonepropionase [Haliscomenobacteraceae bacterium CHB4]|nr:Imidazolonepropionase [Saprospiraceae bacterium]MCE7923564.1 imidazolonepropionase [Haliscomenobacteraceae bacterium CHB4]